MIRAASITDIPTIAQLKLAMFHEAGLTEVLATDALERVTACYRSLYEHGVAQHFAIEQGGSLVACSGAFLKDDLPYCFYRQPVYGFIGDVYTHPDYRRRGYARQLSIEAVNWLKGRGVAMIRLLATPQARPLYAALGFRPSDEMVLKLSGGHG